MKKIWLIILLTIILTQTVIAKTQCNQKYVGRYEQNTGKWKWWFVFNKDCTGSYCTQTLNDWNNPNSSYGWHCDDAKVKNKHMAGKIAKWQYRVTDGFEHLFVTYEDGKTKELEIRERPTWLIIGQAARKK